MAEDHAQDGSFVAYIGGNVDVRERSCRRSTRTVLRVLQRETKLELPDLGRAPRWRTPSTQAIEQPARRRDQLRADRLRQDNDALRRARPPERRAPLDRDDR